MNKKYRNGAMMKPMGGIASMLKRYMNGGMMEYPGGGLMPKQYDNGGPLTRAEARELAKQYEETGELTPQMEELLFSDMSENERQFVSDIISSGRLSGDSTFGNMVESALKGNQPLRFADKFRSNYLKDSEGEVTADNLKRKYDLYGKDGEVLEEGRDKSTPLFRPGHQISRNRLVEGDDLLFPLAKGAKRGYSTPEPEPQPEPRREDPVDPVTPREPVVVRKDPEPTPQRRPAPEPERTYRADLPEITIRPEEEPVSRISIPSELLDFSDELRMPSDYTGSGDEDRATGPFSQQRLATEKLMKYYGLENRRGGFPFRKKKRKMTYRK